MWWNVLFMLIGRYLKSLIPKWKGPFWKFVKFAVAVYKSQLNLELMLWISEFDSYESIFGNK